MRPGRFHPGNGAGLSDEQREAFERFNEAGAFPPRKLAVVRFPVVHEYELQ